MKRLAIFLDGTWNTLNNNTNVWRLKSLCAQTADQYVYYSQGVGTRYGETIRGGMLGYGIDNEILDAYTWLIQHFVQGDEIFIFGFSRGAYTARSLSGLITKCGILRPGAPLSIEQLYDRYKQGRAKRRIDQLQSAASPDDFTLEEQWLVRYSTPTPIKLVGVWDTVGSLGLAFESIRRRMQKYRFLDTHLYRTNQLAFHALALDEHRRSFEPTFWTRTVRKGQPGSTPRPLDQVEQRWFVGAHANVGGGYPSDLLAQAPLKWLMDKASAAGLAFISELDIDTSSVAPPVADSYGQFFDGFYKFISRPFYRPVGTLPMVGTEATTNRINETIDESVFERWRADPAYRPKNLVDWAKRYSIDPASLVTPVLATDPHQTIV
jgi:uncharacterized protein (DUF2235 family)